jgi:3-deoxy-D-manno-octulosonate 8-phosphate phosphatase (KDO 8-P phosphatase)
MSEIQQKARQIQLLILDVDGVMTNGGLQFDAEGREYKTFNSLDGQGMRMLLECGIQIAVITGRKSKLVNHRMNDLGVKLVFQGHRDKRPAFSELLKKTGLGCSQIAYLGDDLPDLAVMGQVGMAIAVDNAHAFVKQQADWVTQASGGSGAVREVTDFILKAQNLLDAKQASYLQ